MQDFTGAAQEQFDAECVLFISYLTFFPLAVPVQKARVHPDFAGWQAVCQTPYKGKAGVSPVSSKPW